MRKIFLTTVALGMLVASHTYAEFIPEKWLLAKDITIPQGIANGTLVGVELDSEVFGNAKNGLGDLRIIDSLGIEVPYVLRSETTRSDVVTYSPKMYDLSYVSGSHTSFIVDFGGNVAHNKITILTSSRNFRRPVTIMGSNDRSSWQTILEGKDIYDYNVEFSARDLSITYPESLYRYLQVRIDANGEAEQLNITGVSAQRFEVTRAKKVSYRPTVTQKEDGKQTIVTVDMGQRGLEIDTAIFSISSQNFQRHVSIVGSDDNKNWSRAGDDVVYGYQTSKVSSNKSTVHFGPIKQRFVRFIIDNYDNQPLNIQNTMTLEGLAHSILFLADGDKTYGLYYGYDKGYMPTYDFESVYQHFDNDEIVRGLLGAQKQSLLYKVPEPIVVPEPTIPWTEKYMTQLISIAYACAGGLLVFLMMRIFQRTKSTSGELHLGE